MAIDLEPVIDKLQTALRELQELPNEEKANVLSMLDWCIGYVEEIAYFIKGLTDESDK